MRVALDFAPGVVTDDTDFAASGGFAETSLVRFYRDRWEVEGGWERFITTTLTGVCRNIIGWTNAIGSLSLAFGTHSKLIAWASGPLVDITPVGLAPGLIDGIGGSGYGVGVYSGPGGYSLPASGAIYPRTWSFGNVDQDLYACPRGGSIYRWQGVVGTPAALLANAPTENSVIVVDPTRNIIVSLGNNATGAFDPMLIANSDSDAPTVWTPSTSNLADRFPLQGGSRLMGGDFVGPGLFVWSDQALFLGQYIGAPDQTFNYTLIGNGHGLVGPNAKAVLGQTAVWIAPDMQFRACSYGGAPQMLECPMRSELLNVAAAQEEKIHAAAIPSFGEVRFFYPDGRYGRECNRAIGFNPSTGQWTGPHEIARTAFVGPPPGQVYPMAVDPHGVVFWHEKSSTAGSSADGGAMPWRARTSFVYMDEGKQKTMVRAIYPDIERQSGAVHLLLHMRDRPQGPTRTHGPYVLTPATEAIYPRKAGKLMALELRGASFPTFARGGKITAEIVPTGVRG